MVMRFDDARHWMPVYRNRLGRNAPAIQMRICTNCMPEKGKVPGDVPVYGEYAPAFLVKLLAARIAMLFGS
jgi:hypothetical protein